MLLHKSVQNNSKLTRINLATLDAERLMKIYTVVKEAQYTSCYGETLVDCDAARALGVSVFCQERTHLFSVSVRNSDGDALIVLVYAIMFYYEPTPCWFLCADGTFCKKTHRTLYEFNSAHRSIDLSRLGFSHLNHQSWCTNPACIVIESTNTNSRRNICGQLCVCGQQPKCYSDPHFFPSN